MPKRTTIYAAVFGDGTPAINVYDFNRKRLDTRVSDRKANGEAHEGERVVRMTVPFYRALLSKHEYPVPVELLGFR